MLYSLSLPAIVTGAAPVAGARPLALSSIFLLPNEITVYGSTDPLICPTVSLILTETFLLKRTPQ